MTELLTMDEVVHKLRKRLAYDPDTGLIWWKVDHGRKIKAGRVVSAINNVGYIILGFDHKSYLGHRVAFLLHTGQWPDGIMDHINGNRSDNRWANLRVCTHSQSNANRGAMRSGKKGTSKTKSGRWESRIQKDGKRHVLGRFDTEAEAHAAYDYAAKRLHGPYARSE